jgi:hypothetical protein
MTATEPSDAAPKTNKDLGLFHGRLIPGIYFESGYCIWAFDFTSTPSPLDPFSDVWIDTPDGERTLYINSDTAMETIASNHPFDRTVSADITIDQTDSNGVRVTVEGEDGTELEMDLSFGQTVGTRLLNVMVALTPKAVARTQIGSALSTFVLNRLVEANGAKVAGRFATGEPYRFEANRIAVVTAATATLDGEDLGLLSSSPQPIEDGDVKNMPIHCYADVYVPVHSREAEESPA